MYPFWISQTVLSKYCLLQVKHLGGDDFDQKIIDWLADNFKKE